MLSSIYIYNHVLNSEILNQICLNRMLHAYLSIVSLLPNISNCVYHSASVQSCSYACSVHHEFRGVIPEGVGGRDPRFWAGESLGTRWGSWNIIISYHVQKVCSKV